MSEEMKNLLPVELKERIDYLSGQEIGHNGIYYVQDAGEKVAGKLYMCKTMKKIFRCTANNSLVYIDDSKYESMSLETLLDKLQNLFTKELLWRRGDSYNTNKYYGDFNFLIISVSLDSNYESTDCHVGIMPVIKGDYYQRYYTGQWGMSSANYLQIEFKSDGTYNFTVNHNGAVLNKIYGVKINI